VGAGQAPGEEVRVRRAGGLGDVEDRERHGPASARTRSISGRRRP
jgi:hypothetical protein